MFSPAGAYVVTVSADRTARLWNDRTGEPIGGPLPHDDEALQVAFNRQATIMAIACRNGSVYLWDVRGVAGGGSALRQAKIKLGGTAGTMAFDPGGGLLLTGSSDNSARLWDVNTADPVGPPLGQGQTVTAVEFGLSGRRALTAGADGTLRLWSVGPAEGDATELTRWAEAATGMTTDGSGTLRWLSVAEWRERYRPSAN
jgi:WD40 repeat protein